MKKRILAAALALCLLFSLAACAGKRQSADSKKITFTVVHGDGSSKDFTVTSEKELLGDALQDEKLISGEVGAYGLFVTTVDGETADADNQEWWCLTKGGESVNTGVDTTPFADGDRFEFTLTVGW